MPEKQRFEETTPRPTGKNEIEESGFGMMIPLGFGKDKKED